MGRARACIVGALAVLALGACIPITLHESKLEKTVPKSVGAIDVGETTRGKVRELLGEPLITSEYWRFDAFRMTDTNAGVVVFPPYIPIPSWTTETAYALVTYAEDGRVAGTGWTWSMSGIWSIGHGDDVAAVSSGVSLHASGGTVFLAASPESRDAYLRDFPTHERCRAVIGCAGDSCDAMVTVDGRTDVAFRSAVTPLSSGLVAVELEPGQHRIDLTGSEAKFNAAAEFECDAGDRRFVSIDLDEDETASGRGSRRNLVARLEVSNELPETFAGQRLLIWANQQWLVPPEPGR